MFKNRIELESDSGIYNRYERAILGRQKTYEFFWELQQTFGKGLFGGFVKEALNEMDKLSYEDMGRRRFFRVAGPLRVPLPSVPNQVSPH